MEALKIEKGVPIPSDGRGTARAKYEEPMRKMKVGDSFYVPNQKIPSVQSALARWKFKLGIQIITRTEGNGVRVWRTK